MNGKAKNTRPGIMPVAYIDHTLCDLIVVDDCTNLPSGRHTITTIQEPNGKVLLVRPVNARLTAPREQGGSDVKTRTAEGPKRKNRRM